MRDPRHLRLGDAEHDSPDVAHDAHAYPHTDETSGSQFLIRIRIGLSHGPVEGAAMDLPAIVRSLMSEAGMTQESIAEALEVAQSSVSRMVNRGQEPSYSVGLRIIDLAGRRGLLTNKSGTLQVVSSIPMRGRMSGIDEVAEPTDGHALADVDLPFSVPAGCFAVVVDADGLTARARKGDLLIAGPASIDPSSMIDVEGVFKLSDGRCFFGVLIEGRGENLYTILCHHSKRVTNVEISEVGPFFAVVAAGRWRTMA